jgi:hypothetical protein
VEGNGGGRKGDVGGERVVARRSGEPARDERGSVIPGERRGDPRREGGSRRRGGEGEGRVMRVEGGEEEEEEERGEQGGEGAAVGGEKGGEEREMGGKRGLDKGHSGVTPADIAVGNFSGGAERRREVGEGMECNEMK